MSGLKAMGSEMGHSEIALTIIISCYNTRELTRDGLQSIYENPPRPDLNSKLTLALARH